MRVDALGAIARDGSDIVEIIGPLTLGTLLPAQVVLPEGDAGVVLVVARKIGQIRIDFVFGSAWGSRQTSTVLVEVED
ncbi:hypothetical protein ACU8OG_26595 (plasmid) [Rhizobium leguminosarum]